MAWCTDLHIHDLQGKKKSSCWKWVDVHGESVLRENNITGDSAQNLVITLTIKLFRLPRNLFFFFFFLIVWGGKRGVISYTWSGAHQQKQEGRGWLCVSSDAQPKITESFWFYIHRTTPKLDVWMPVEKKANRKPHDCWHGCARFI